jgi:adenylosuccinate lyase
MATETLLMQAVQRGGDRQKLHEMIRQASHEAAAQIKAGGDNDLLDRLGRNSAFAALSLAEVCKPREFVGRAPEQVTEFLAEVVRPIRERYKDKLGQRAEVSV